MEHYEQDLKEPDFNPMSYKHLEKAQQADKKWCAINGLPHKVK